MTFLTSTTYYSDGGDEVALLAGAAFLLFGFIGLISYLFFGITGMAIFQKAKHPKPWAALVPVYNSWVLFEIGKQKGWFILVLIGAGFLNAIPVIGPLIYMIATISYLVAIGFAYVNINKAFGKDPVSWTILAFLLPVIWLAILAWGKDKYDHELANGPFLFNSAATLLTGQPAANNNVYNPPTDNSQTLPPSPYGSPDTSYGSSSSNPYGPPPTDDNTRP